MIIAGTKSSTGTWTTKRTKHDHYEDRNLDRDKDRENDEPRVVRLEVREDVGSCLGAQRVDLDVVGGVFRKRHKVERASRTGHRRRTPCISMSVGTERLEAALASAGVRNFGHLATDAVDARRTSRETLGDTICGVAKLGEDWCRRVTEARVPKIDSLVSRDVCAVRSRCRWHLDLAVDVEEPVGALAGAQSKLSVDQDVGGLVGKGDSRARRRGDDSSNRE